MDDYLVYLDNEINHRDYTSCSVCKFYDKTLCTDDVLIDCDNRIVERDYFDFDSD